MKTIAIFALLAISANSVAAQTMQFDLLCTGASKYYRNGQKGNEDFSQVIHVDLSGSQYCVDDCKDVQAIQNFDPLKIVLVNAHVQYGLTYKNNVRIIDRSTGKYSIAYANSDSLESLDVSASCLPKEFTPFPSTKF